MFLSSFEKLRNNLIENADDPFDGAPRYHGPSTRSAVKSYLTTAFVIENVQDRSIKAGICACGWQF